MLIFIEMLCIVEKAVLVKMYFMNSESAIATLQEYRFMKSMRDGKRSITFSAFNNMMKNFKSKGSLVSRPRSGRPSAIAAVATNVEQTI